MVLEVKNVQYSYKSKKEKEILAWKTNIAH